MNRPSWHRSGTHRASYLSTALNGHSTDVHPRGRDVYIQIADEHHGIRVMATVAACTPEQGQRVAEAIVRALGEP